MRPRDRDHRRALNDGAQGIGTPHDGDTALTRPFELGMVDRDSGRHHHRSGVVHVRRIMALEHANSQRLQVASTRSVVIATTYRHPAAPGE